MSEGVWDAAYAWCGCGWGKTSDLASGMIDVAAPRLAEQSFVDGVADATKTDCVGACSAGRHLLEGGIRKAAFAFVKSVMISSFLFIDVKGKFRILVFLIFSPFI